MRKWILIMFLLILPRMIWAQINVNDTITEHSMVATYYSDKFEGRKTSSGEVFRQSLYTAAHKNIKLGTLVLVTNKKTGQQVIVKVNDRCPRAGVLDLTRQAARVIGMKGSVPVTVKVLPGRYAFLWEMQSEGLLAEVLGTTALTSAQPPQSITSQTSSTAKKAEGQSSKKITENEKDPESTLYNLILCETRNRSEAQSQINLLPMFYRDKAVVYSDLHNGKVKVRLNLAMRAKNVEQIKSELDRLFPESRLEKAY